MKMNGPNMVTTDKLFQKYFQMPFKDFWDRSLTALTGEIKVDVDKLDEWALNDESYNEKIDSISSYIEKTKGKEAVNLIEELL